MTPLMQWAEAYAIPPAALTALLQLMGAGAPPDCIPGGVLHSEAAVQQQARLRGAQRGMWLLRNNSGVAQGENGRPIRFGLANESKEMNEQIKSSDLIGITPITCRCGWRYGVFTGLECKPLGWHLTPGDKRGQAQLRFGQKVISMGGIFRFVSDPAQIGEIA